MRAAANKHALVKTGLYEGCENSASGRVGESVVVISVDVRATFQYLDIGVDNILVSIKAVRM